MAAEAAAADFITASSSSSPRMREPTRTNPLPSFRCSIPRASGRVCHCVSNCLDAAVNSAAQPFQRTKNGRTTDPPGPEPPARRRGRTLSDQGTGATAVRGVGCCRRAKKRESEAFQWPSPPIRKCCSGDGGELEREIIGWKEKATGTVNEHGGDANG